MDVTKIVLPEEKYAKDLMGMRYFLIGKEYHSALRAMEFARSFHNGYRKDGVTPEFSHQLFLARYVKTILPGIMFPEETLATIFLHDICEDYDIGFEEIKSRFGASVENSVKLLTKKYRGTTVPYKTYFEALSHDPIASIGKGVDRAHNIFTMSAAGWTTTKQQEYVDEVDMWFLPMLKSARRNFSEQEPAYENVKTMLLLQMQHIRLNLELIDSHNESMETSSPKM